MAVWRGVYVPSGTFEMSGGEISGNGANYSGGGVFVLLGGTFEMSGGEISGNEASNGGGVFVAFAGTFEMSGGTISGNSTSDGGGVLVANSTFEMSGGEISGNTSDGWGGGVYVYSGTFTKGTNGIIYGSNGGTLKNTADGDDYGHAVFAYSENKKRNTTAGVGVTLNSGTNSNWEK